MNRFLQVKQILDTAVGGPAAAVGAPHQAFWRNLTRDQFAVFDDSRDTDRHARQRR